MVSKAASLMCFMRPRPWLLLQSDNGCAVVKTPSGEQIECPSCGSTDLRFSNKPHFLNFLMAFVLRDPIRCCRCRFRFYQRALTDAEYLNERGRRSATGSGGDDHQAE